MALKHILLLSAVVAVAAAVPSHKGHKASPVANITGRPNYDFIKWYDCSQKEDGDYPNPRDCTRFIKCSNGNAADMACPDCPLADNPGQCAGSEYLVWDDTVNVKRCEWPESTKCEVTDLPETTVDPGTTPERTTADPGTTLDASSPPAVTETPTPEPEPTEDPTTQPPAPSVCDGRQAGDSCDADDCEHCGYCRDKHSFYFRCNRTIPSDPKIPITGVIVQEKCDEHLWWNPDLKPSGAAVGGACDNWENLSSAVQDAYNEDPECVAEICEWGQEDDQKCSGNYWYYDPKTHGSWDKRESLQCNGGLLWDQATETCRSCAHVEDCSCN